MFFNRPAILSAVSNCIRLCNQSFTPLLTRGFHGLTVAPAPSGLAAPLGVDTKLLTPTTSFVTQIAGFKQRGRLKRRCKDCYFVVRKERLYVICPTHPRHKQMSIIKKESNTWILTHATQSKVRPYWELFVFRRNIVFVELVGIIWNVTDTLCYLELLSPLCIYKDTNMVNEGELREHVGYTVTLSQEDTSVNNGTTLLCTIRKY